MILRIDNCGECPAKAPFEGVSWLICCLTDKRMGPKRIPSWCPLRDMELNPLKPCLACGGKWEPVKYLDGSPSRDLELVGECDCGGYND